MGADFTLAPGDDVKDKVFELTKGVGADVVIETVGVLPVLANAIDYARIGGRLLLFGIYTAREANLHMQLAKARGANLPFYDLYFKELALINARAARREDFPSAIGMVSRGDVQLDSMVSHVLPLIELDRAIEMLAERDDQRMKVILDHAV